jgi:hypothetical protein
MEKMERRQLLAAGNVTASIIGGVLTIEGDKKDNIILIDSNDDFTTTVLGVGTTINGAPGFATFVGLPPISVDLGDGHDTVSFSDMGLQSVDVDTGKGNDTVIGAINGSTPNIFGHLTINTGDGDDDIVLAGNTGVASDLNVDTGKGKDTFDVFGSLGVGGNVKIKMGDKDDAVHLSGSINIGGNLEVDGGKGGKDLLSEIGGSVVVGGTITITRIEKLIP